jgi:flagellar basal-body rod protein FlgB
MDFSKIDIMRMMQTKMNYHSERQDILSHNIANVDTPGFRARDLAPLDFSEELRRTNRLQMARTSVEHKEGVRFDGGDYQPQQMRSFETKPVKNAVNVEEQMSQISHNAFELQQTTTLYRKTAEMFRVAVTNR